MHETDLKSATWRLTVSGLLMLSMGLVVAPQILAATELPAKQESLDQVLSINYRSRLFSYSGRVLVTKAQKRLVTHSDPMEQLLGGFFQSNLLAGVADQIARPILSQDKTPKGRDRTWFYIGQRYIRFGMIEAAEKAWERVGKNLPVELEARRRMLLAGLYLERGEIAAANRLLTKIRPLAAQRGVVNFNRGIGKIRASESADASRILTALTEQAVANEQQQALVDRALLTLGYQLAMKGASDLALKTVSRVAEGGPYKKRARLIEGWLRYRSGEYSRALAVWNRLAMGEPSDPNVQEALLGRARAMEKTGDLKNALLAYSGALDTFQQQIAVLSKAVASAENGGFVRAMEEWYLASGVPGEDRWILPDIYPADRPELWYMKRSLTGHRLNEYYRNYRRHALLQLIVDAWRGDIPRFRQILAKDAKTFTAAQPERLAFLQRKQVEGVPKSALQWMLGLDAKGSSAASITDIRLARLVGSPGSNPRKHRLRLLRGLAKWNGQGSAIAKQLTTRKSDPAVIKAAQLEFDSLEQQRFRVDSANMGRHRSDLLTRLKRLDGDLKKIRPRVRNGVLGQIARMVQEARDDMLSQRRQLERNMLRANLAASRMLELLETAEATK